MSVWHSLREAATDAAAHEHLLLSLDGLLARSGRLSRAAAIKWWHSGDSTRPGELRSNRRGAGFELDSIGPWQQGDDFRHIDWAASARSGRTQVQRFRVEVESRLILLIDLRSSMFFGTGDQLMAHTAMLASSRLAWSLSTNHELFGLAIIEDQHTEYHKPERGRRARLRQFQRLVDVYNRILPIAREQGRDGGSNASLAQRLAPLPRRLPRDAQIILVSDFSHPGREFKQWCHDHDARRITAVVVDDELFCRAPPAAVYPAQSSAGRRQVARITRSGRAQYAQTASQSRRELHRRLRDIGIRRILACDAQSVARESMR